VSAAHLSNKPLYLWEFDMLFELRTTLCALTGALVCLPASAGVIQYGGQEYVTIDWNTDSEMRGEGFGAYGNAGGVEVFFRSVGLTSTDTVSYDYSTDSAFDAVSFGGGMVESLTIFGGESGLSSLSFSQTVGDVLIIIGAPGQSSFATQLGASRWEFQDDSIAMDVVDSEQNTGGFRIDDGLFRSPTANQISGILGASGEFNTLEWLQGSNEGRDKLQISFAVVVPTVPAPGGALVLLIPAAMCGRRRR